MLKSTIYTCTMMLSAKQFMHWRQNLKKTKMKQKIENLSNEWDQLTQCLMIIEQTAFQDHQRYERDFNDLQSRIAQLCNCKESYEDMKHVLLDVVSTEDASPKEFQRVSNEFFEVMCELNRLQRNMLQFQEEFNNLYENREQNVSQHQEIVKELKEKIHKIETELSNLRLSS
jgi:DNA repair exonuclease SbcCD ATPase subunit